MYQLQKYKSVSSGMSHRLKNLKIGDWIDINPIYIDPGWKPGQIKNVYNGQIHVAFMDSVTKRDILYWVHLDNEIECKEFGKGQIDLNKNYKMFVEASFYSTISSHKFRIVEQDKLNVYEALLKTKCKNGKLKCTIEKYLWHGTQSIDTLKLIIKNGKFGSENYFVLGKKLYVLFLKIYK